MSRPLPSFSETFGMSPINSIPSIYEHEDSEYDSTPDDEEPVSTPKFKKLRPIRSLNKTSQRILLNVHQYFTQEKEKKEDLVEKSKVLERTARAVGLTRQTVSKYISSGDVIETPDKKRSRRDEVDKMDDFTLCVLRAIYSESD